MWDPEKYSGIERLNMATETADARIWLPDIKLLNTYVILCTAKFCSLFDHPRSGVVYNFGRVCLSVCLMITFESLNVGSSYLHIRCISRTWLTVPTEVDGCLRLKFKKNCSNCLVNLHLVRKEPVLVNILIAVKGFFFTKLLDTLCWPPFDLSPHPLYSCNLHII